MTAKSFYAVADEGTNYGQLEMTLASDRIYVLNDPEVPVELGITVANAGMFPMSNGISRLETRFLGEPDRVGEVLEHMRQITAEEADELGLATAPDEIDLDNGCAWPSRSASFSPDALTGRGELLAGPETMETVIFGRLTAGRTRPAADREERGAPVCYGTPMRSTAVERTREHPHFENTCTSAAPG